MNTHSIEQSALSMIKGTIFLQDQILRKRFQSNAEMQRFKTNNGFFIDLLNKPQPVAYLLYMRLLLFLDFLSLLFRPCQSVLCFLFSGSPSCPGPYAAPAGLAALCPPLRGCSLSPTPTSSSAPPVTLGGPH